MRAINHLKKYSYYFFKLIFDFFYSLFQIIYLLIILRKKKNIFLSIEGGFGHTISESHLLNIKYKNNWILIFGYRKSRHNKLIKNFFQGKLFFFEPGIFIEPRLKKILEKIFQFFFKVLLKKDINITSEYILSLPYNNLSSQKYLLTHDSRIFQIFKNSNANTYSDVIQNINSIYLNNTKKNFKGIISFYIRNKAKLKKSKLYSDIIRDSYPFDFYKKTIEFLVKSNWRLMLSGDVISVPDWIKEFDESIIYRSKTNLSEDEYGILVGVKSDIFIGSSSGAAMYNLINPKIKTLLLADRHVGWGYINTIVSYPKIKFYSKKDFKEKIINCASDFNIIFEMYKNYPEVLQINEDEILEIVKEFIINIENKYYGVSAVDLGIDNGPLYDSGSKFSEVWLKMINYYNLK